VNYLSRSAIVWVRPFLFPCSYTFMAQKRNQREALDEEVVAYHCHGIVDDGNTIADKRKGRNITDKLRVSKHTVQ